MRQKIIPPENLEIIWKALHIFACKTYVWQSRFLITSRWCFQEFYKIRSGSVRTIFKLWNNSSVQLIETESKPKACFARQIGFHLFNFVAGIFWQLLGRSRGLIERPNLIIFERNWNIRCPCPQYYWLVQDYILALLVYVILPGASGKTTTTTTKASTTGKNKKKKKKRNRLHKLLINYFSIDKEV